MHVFDITTAANFFGRVTGIARVEMMLAHAMVRRADPVRFVYWSNDKGCFEAYDGPLDPEQVRLSKLGFDYAQAFDPDRHGLPDIAPQGRVLVVTGSGWLQNTRYTIGCLEHARAAGMTTLFYVHDLIPILFPYYYSPDYVATFARNLDLIAQHADVLACNSRNTEQDLLSWCARQGIAPPRTTVAFPGDGFDTGRQPDFQPDPAALPAGLEDRDIVLAVGAIHRRKNYELLAMVWRRLAARMGSHCPTLVIVGGVTADGRTLAQEIALDPILSKWIRVVADVHDGQLDTLYRTAKLVLYPSRYEGWGLPVAEALHYGRVCLASNTSAIPEVADLGPDSLAPDDVPGWTSRILHYLQSPQSRLAREGELSRLRQLRDWTDTAAQLVGAIDSVPAREAPLLFPGDEIDLSQPASLRFLQTPSYGPEKWGRWFTGRGVRFRFGLPDAATEMPCILRLRRLRRLSDDPCTVTLNGRVLVGRRLADGSDVDIPLPSGLLAPDNLLTVEVPAASPVPDRNRKPWVVRLSGIGLGAMALLTTDHVTYDRETELRSLDPGASMDLRLPRLVAVPPNGTAGLQVRQPGKHQDRPDGALHMAFSGGWPGPDTSGPPAPAIWLQVRTRDAAVHPAFAVRQDRQLLHARGPEGNHPLVSTRDGRHLIAVTPRPTPEDLTLEVVGLAGSPPAPIAFELLGAWVPPDLLDMHASLAARVLPPVATGDYLRFGEDGDPVAASVLGAGWQTALSSATTDLMGTIAVRLGPSHKPAERLKLRIKRLSEAMPGARVRVNGQDHALALTDDLQNHILPIHPPLADGDPLVVQVTPDLGDAAPDPRNKVVLRAMQLE